MVGRMTLRGMGITSLLVLASCGVSEPAATAPDPALQEILAGIPPEVLADPALAAVASGDAAVERRGSLPLL